MKRMKTSERKKTHSSLIFHLFFLCLFLTVSCTQNKKNYDFKSSDDALKYYQNVLRNIQHTKTCTSKQFVAMINDCKEVSDTVYGYIRKDKSFKAHSGLSTAFMMITDNIRNEYDRLTFSGRYGMSDVVYIKLNTSTLFNECGIDDEYNKIISFFRDLRSNAGNITDTCRLDITSYELFLKQTLRKKINSEQELKDFIVREDTYFNSFLSNLRFSWNSDLTVVTKLTEEVCTSIYNLAEQHKIPGKKVLVYMSMRTNKRLIDNAKVCSELLLKDDDMNRLQANIYLWMFIQPYLAIDSFGVSVLQSEQRQNIMSLAAQYPEITSKLVRMGLADKDVVEILPSRLLRLYLNTL